MKRRTGVAIGLGVAILFLTIVVLGSVDPCPCDLSETDCGCCHEYTGGYHLAGYQCWGSGGVCTYRHCLYVYY